MTERIRYVGVRRESPFLGGWSRDVEVGGKRYHCTVRRGRRVVIPYKPRGKNIGFEWWGYVSHDGIFVASFAVNKSTGCRGLLKLARIINDGRLV